MTGTGWSQLSLICCMETNKYENKLADSVDCCCIQMFTPCAEWSVFAVWEVTSSVNISCCCLCRLFPTNSSLHVYYLVRDEKINDFADTVSNIMRQIINPRTEKNDAVVQSSGLSIDVNQLSYCSMLVRTAVTCAILQSVISVNLIQPWNPQSQTRRVSQFGEISPRSQALQTEPEWVRSLILLATRWHLVAMTRNSNRNSWINWGTS